MLERYIGKHAWDTPLTDHIRKQQQEQLYDLIAATTTRVPLGETPHQSPRRGTNARLLSSRVLHRRITAFRRRRSRFRSGGGGGGGGGGGSSLFGRFRTSSSSPCLRLLSLVTWGRRTGDEVGWEDIVKGDAAVMSFPPPLLLPVLLLPLPPPGVMTGPGLGPGLGPGPGALAGSKRRLGVRLAIHFVNRSAAGCAHYRNIDDASAYEGRNGKGWKAYYEFFVLTQVR
jgi:hypothetical protein